MGGGEMIDLISHGLTLRKQPTVLIDHPQKIRSISASTVSCGVKESAKSAESAIGGLINEGFNQDFFKKITTTAGNVDRADIQSVENILTADVMRKNCGLNVNLSFVSNQDLIVTCNACEHFTPDTIGDGFGIGECYLGVKWTQEFDGRRPLYRYADRHCEKFSKLMS